MVHFIGEVSVSDQRSFDILVHELPMKLGADGVVDEILCLEEECGIRS